MRVTHVLSVVLVGALSASALAQIPETTLFQIQQGGIGSNGFGTTWRGQDLVLAEDAWVTRIAFEAGSAAANLDEMRLMSAMPSPLNLAVSTALTISGNWVEAVLPAPYYLRGGTRYTVWFHQNGSPRGTYGCDLHLVDPTWGGHHTNVDPTQIPGPGEPSYFRNYRYGTNVRITGYDNLEVSAASLGGPVTIDLQANPADLFSLFFGVAPFDLELPPIAGPLRVDPTRVLVLVAGGSTDPRGAWSLTFTIPANPILAGSTLYGQAYHMAPGPVLGAFTSMEVVPIR